MGFIWFLPDFNSQTTKSLLLRWSTYRWPGNVTRPQCKLSHYATTETLNACLINSRNILEKAKSINQRPIPKDSLFSLWDFVQPN